MSKKGDALKSILFEYDIVLYEKKVANNSLLNDVFFCKTDRGKLVIKISKDQKSRLKNEFCFLKIFEKTNNLVPQAIFWDESRKILAMTNIEGDNLAELFDKKKISSEDLTDYYFKMGKTLREIHSKHLDLFGELEVDKSDNITIKPTPPKDEDLSYFSKIQSDLEKIKNSPFGCVITEASRYIQSKLKTMRFDKFAPSIVHGDFEPWNILIKNKNISGIIDSEFAFSGNPLIDLTPEFPSVLNEIACQKLNNNFLRGYGFKLTKDKIAQLEFYRNIKLLKRKILSWDIYSRSIEPETAQIEIIKIINHFKKLGGKND